MAGRKLKKADGDHDGVDFLAQVAAAYAGGGDGGDEAAAFASGFVAVDGLGRPRR